MPFVVSHEPPAALIGAAGYGAGLGEFEKFRLQRQLALQESANRQRALDLQAQNQAFGQAFSVAQLRNQQMQAGFGRLAQFGLANANIQAQQAALKQRRGFEVEDRDAADKLRRDLAMMGEKGAMDRALMIGDRAREDAAADAARAAEDDRRRFIMESYERGDRTLNAGTKARLGQIRNQMMDARMSPRLTPQQKQQKLQELDAQYWDILEAPQPELPGERPKPLPQQFQEEVVPNPNPDGSVSYWAKDRNGMWMSRETTESPQAKEAEIRKEALKLWSSMYDPETEEERMTLGQAEQYIRFGKLPDKPQEKPDHEQAYQQARSALGPFGSMFPATLAEAAQQQPQQPQMPQSGLGAPPTPYSQRAPGSLGGPQATPESLRKAAAEFYKKPTAEAGQALQQVAQSHPGFVAVQQRLDQKLQSGAISQQQYETQIKAALMAPTIKTESEYERLPGGSVYWDSKSGQLMTKPKDKTPAVVRFAGNRVASNNPAELILQGLSPGGAGMLISKGLKAAFGG